MQEFAAIGKRIPKLDAADKAAGRIQYIQDIKLPGMLYGKILYSKYPHAKIQKIDTTRARELPGVRVILTGEDIPVILHGGWRGGGPQFIMATPNSPWCEMFMPAPGGPKAATLRSPHSASSSTTIASISRVWLSSNSVVVVCR